ncbi:MAG TPA: M15 family metallopeptidase [Arachidicoccus sp.]
MSKKNLLSVSFLLVCFYCTCNKSDAQVYKKNKYNLEIIDNIPAYKAFISKKADAKLVLLTNFVPDLKTDFVYATPDNFTHTVLYQHPKPYALLPVAEALAKVSEDLKKNGLAIMLFDAYRPYSVTEKMWQAVPDARYAADPKFGSGHNRGISVDITLYNLSDAKPLQMPTAFDNFTDTAHSGFEHLPQSILANRKLLRDVMAKYGFVQLPTEWWHFSIANPKAVYKIIDLSFDELNNFVKAN